MCSHRWLNCVLNCHLPCFAFVFSFFNPLTVLQNWLVFQANCEGRVHNVGQQIRASCWLHIASDTPTTDRQSYINFPNLHAATQDACFSFAHSFSKCAWNFMVTLLPKRTPNGQPACPVYWKDELVNKDKSLDNVSWTLIFAGRLLGNDAQPVLLILLTA